MQVIIKSGAIIQHQMMKEVAKPVALKKMTEIAKREEIKATDKWYRARVDVAEAARNARFYKKNLEKVNPERLLPASKDAMWRRAKQLKDEFVVGMLSHEELHPVKGFSDHGVMKWVVDEEKMRTLQSVERNSAWLKKNEPKIREFKNIMRHLCPENPNAGDIERFRPRLKNIH